MRNCFVPGCDQQHKASPKRAMFSIPKSKVMLDKWIEALPKHRTLKLHDKICCHHFRQDDVISTYDHTIKGKIHRLKRGRARLNPDAIPMVNLVSEVDLKKNNDYASVDNLNNISHKTKPSKQDLNQGMATKGSLMSSDIETGQLQESLQDCERVSDCNDPKNISYTKIMEADEVVGIDSRYSSIFNDVESVILPNSLWAVHRCPKRSSLFFTYMDINQLRCTKVIKIASDGVIKVFYDNSLIAKLNIMDGLYTPESLSKMLRKIDTMKIQHEKSDDDTEQSDDDEIVITELRP